MYFIPYEADFECEKGHKFTADVGPNSGLNARARCPHCLEEWLSKNVPDGQQVTVARPVSMKTKFA